MAKEAIIFDFFRTLYDPERGELYAGVGELLAEQAKRRRLFLFTRREGNRDSFVEELGIAQHFEKMYFVASKNADGVRQILEENDLSAGCSLIVGDLLPSELAAGRDAGLDTIWIRQGRFADVLADPYFEPTHTVRSIAELRDLLESIA